MIAKKELNGEHLWSPGFDSEIPQAYGVSGIPSYWIIDKNGTIADNRPSGDNIVADIEKVLNQSN